MNGRFSIVMHVMTLLCKTDGRISSDFIAGSLNVNPVIVRKELSNLIKHNLVVSHGGKNGGYLLAKPARYIDLASIYNTVKTRAVLGTAKNEPNPDCPVGQQINSHLNLLNQDIEQMILYKLLKINLAEFCERFK